MANNTLYSKGALVWLKDEETVWAVYKVETYSQEELTLEKKSGQRKTIKLNSAADLPHLKNPDILIGLNDLTSLSYLHEPAVLDNLNYRFAQQLIYTYCGIVLVAINPYEELSLYATEIIRAYHQSDTSLMDPHVFAVAEVAYKNMSSFEENQSIIVSGESGAGKTVSAKYAMRYFAIVSKTEEPAAFLSATPTSGGANNNAMGADEPAGRSIETKVLASNPIMEAFGNAKTTRNDNSSRFGKYVQIGFSRFNVITGAHMRTYLLEKSRVVFQADDERNYHVFYQLCCAAGNGVEDLEKFNLGHQDQFEYTNKGRCPYVTDVDDASDFTTTREAFEQLGVGRAQQRRIYSVLAAILHLGNVEIVDNGRDACYVAGDDFHLKMFADLLKVDLTHMGLWLCYRQIQTASDRVDKPLTASQAVFSRDALAKHMYSQLFNYVVELINKSLASDKKQEKFIGVLDIYGFEMFETNSFEQFCINYANEKLQQQFNLHVFKLEQEEYLREGIEWSFIEFYDNQPCIDLIEAKLGILDLLDEECRVPNGSDANWSLRLYERFLKTAPSSHFGKPRMSQTSFLVKHFADQVEYQVAGFLEKNRDTVLQEQLNILRASEIEFVADLFVDETTKAGHIGAPANAKKPRLGSSSRTSKKTVGSQEPLFSYGQPVGGGASRISQPSCSFQFRTSLGDLMKTLNATTPHYIRCIKPNDSKAPFVFEPHRVVQQLRACGVLETIRISSAGFPGRWSYQDFFVRYRLLAGVRLRHRSLRQLDDAQLKSCCEAVLRSCIEDSDKYRLGKTKVFFRAGQVAYLEKLRADKLFASAITIQRVFRGWSCRRRYQLVRRSVLLLQRHGRGLLARRLAQWLRETRAATIIQSRWRGMLCRRRFLSIRGWLVGRREIVGLRRAATFLAKSRAQCRGLLARQHFRHKLYDHKATIIQKWVRGWLARRETRRYLHAVVLAQSLWRRRQAKKELRQLKIEARSVAHIQKVNKGLENKIIQLQQRLDDKTKESNQHRDNERKTQQELTNVLEQLQSSRAEAELLTDQLAELRALLEEERAKLVAVEAENKSIIAHWTDKFEQLQAKQEAILAANDQVEHGVSEAVPPPTTPPPRTPVASSVSNGQSDGQMAGTPAQRDQSERDQLEASVERQHHQRVLKEMERLQQRNENLERENELLRTAAAATDSDNTNANADGATTSTPERKTSVSALLSPSRPSGQSADIGVVLKQQNRIKHLERENSQLHQQLTTLRDRRQSHTADRQTDGLRSQDLEIENHRLQRELQRTRQALADVSTTNNPRTKNTLAVTRLQEQLGAMETELEHRREENIALKSQLASKTRDMGRIALENYGGNVDLINEDGELYDAYVGQKETNKLLVEQLRAAQSNEEEQKKQADELRRENNRQQKLIQQHLIQGNKQGLIEAVVQHEISRLSSENLSLQEKLDQLEGTVARLRQRRRARRQRQLAIANGSGGNGLAPSDSDDSDNSTAADADQQAAVADGPSFFGMFEFNASDQALILAELVTNFGSRMASGEAADQWPEFPAFALVMCVRYADHIQDEELVNGLLSAAIKQVRQAVRPHRSDTGTVSLWLAVVVRLVNLLRQYSGEPAYQLENTALQNDHALKNYDLANYRQVLTDEAFLYYQMLVAVMQDSLQSMVVPALLEHEAIPALDGPAPTRRDSCSVPANRLVFSAQDLIGKLDGFLGVLRASCLEPTVVGQLLRQLFYFMASTALNSLLLRKDLCCLRKGMMIRYNVSMVEQWVRTNQLVDYKSLLRQLQPLVEAAQLLQARKLEQDASNICDAYPNLNANQISKVLNLYTPAEDYEDRVPLGLIAKVKELLAERRPSKSHLLLMDTGHQFHVELPFSASPVHLNQVSLPRPLRPALSNLLRRI